METLTGIIRKDGSVLAEDGSVHFLPKRGLDKEGYPEVAIDAKEVNGEGFFSSQSIKPFIGMIVEFVRVNKFYTGYNFVILKKHNS